MEKKQKKTNDYIIKNINELISLNDKRRGKYAMNYRYYNNVPYTNERSIRDPAIIGYYEGAWDTTQEQDTTRTPCLNIIKQAVDTLYNKLAEVKVRPFFNTINGSFEDMEKCKQAQQYFDIFYDKENVYRTVSDTFKDACVFDTGNIYIDEETKKIDRILPGFVYFRPSEKYYNKVTRVYILKKDYPTIFLDTYNIKYNTNAEYVDLGIYYDTVAKIKAFIINGEVIEVKAYEKSVVPVVTMYYNTPQVGTASISVVDMLRGIQRSINKLTQKINDASQKNSPNMIIVPEGSNVQEGSLNNRIGQIIKYRPAPGVTNPVTTITNDFISPQYMQTLKELIQQGFAMVGLSELSTQAKKPAGLDSGVSLATYENIESDRHEAILSQIVRAYVDIARISIEVFDGDILPKKENRLDITWKDIQDSIDTMNIQFSAAESLSKDPSEKLKQLQALASAGIIPQSRIAQLLELPDLEAGYSLSNNVVYAAQRLVANTIRNNKVEMPEGDFIPFTIIKEEIISCQNSLYANNKDGKNNEAINILNKLYSEVLSREKKYQNPVGEAVEETTNNGLPVQKNILTSEAGINAKADSSGDWTTESVQQQ